MKNLWLLVIFLILTGCGFSKDEWSDEDRSRIKYCVELTGVNILKHCFGGDKTAYSRWKGCVEAGRDPVKCYVKKVTPPPPTEVGELNCGERPYFCFRYLTVSLSENEVDTWESYLVTEDPSLRRREFCVYQAHPDWHKLELKGFQFHDFLFDITGQSTCGSQAIEDRAKFQVDNTVLGTYAGNLRAIDPIPYVRIDGGSYYQPGSQTLFFRLKPYSLTEVIPSSPRQFDSAGDFAFIARIEGTNQYMIVFDGKFDMRGHTGQ